MPSRGSSYMRRNGFQGAYSPKRTVVQVGTRLRDESEAILDEMDDVMVETRLGEGSHSDEIYYRNRINTEGPRPTMLEPDQQRNSEYNQRAHFGGNTARSDYGRHRFERTSSTSYRRCRTRCHHKCNFMRRPNQHFLLLCPHFGTTDDLINDYSYYYDSWSPLLCDYFYYYY